VLTQTYQDFELIVVDDASTDDTEAIVRAFADARIRYVAHKENRGGSAARNTGIELSSGEHVAFLDSDDEWFADKLRHQLDVLHREEESVALVYSAFEKVYPDGTVERVRRPTRGVSVGFLSRWLLRRAALDDVGGFDENMAALQDTEISIRLLQRHRASFDPKVLMRYHLSSDSVCRNVDNLVSACQRLIQQYGTVVTRREVSYWHLLLGKAWMMQGQVGKGRTALFRALSLHPGETRVYPALLASLLGYELYGWLRHAKRRLRFGHVDNARGRQGHAPPGPASHSEWVNGK
jgi:glycosyltransferase involved in cell wall biosynthesis